MRLIPIRTLVSVSHSKTPPAVATMSVGLTPLAPLAPLAQGSLPAMVLVDEGQQQTLFEISGPTADYCSRVCDLVTLLKHVR